MSPTNALLIGFIVGFLTAIFGGRIIKFVIFVAVVGILAFLYYLKFNH